MNPLTVIYGPVKSFMLDEQAIVRWEPEVKNKSFEIEKATCFSCPWKLQPGLVKGFRILGRNIRNRYSMAIRIRSVLVSLPGTYSSDLVSCPDGSDVSTFLMICPEFSRFFILHIRILF